MAKSWHEGYEEQEEEEEEGAGQLSRLDRRRNYSLKQLRPPHQQPAHQPDLRSNHRRRRM